MHNISYRSLARRGRIAALALSVALGTSVTSPLVSPGSQAAHAAEIAIAIHERLISYGAWRTSQRFGEVWVPRVHTEWRPYTEGRWVWTDDGWFWESTEPFGDVVYHYGRWAYDPDYGWVWVAGDVWAPAWVVWREGGDDVGWAPAPPDVVDVTFEDAWWSFVPVAAIGAVDLVRVIRPVEENVTIVRNTTIINNNNTVVVNNNAPRVRMGNQLVAINAGPRLDRFPKPVVAQIKAAKVLPPNKGVFAAGRLDPSKGAAIKKLAGNGVPPAGANGNGNPNANGNANANANAGAGQQGHDRKKMPGKLVSSPPVTAPDNSAGNGKPGDNAHKRLVQGNNGTQPQPLKRHAAKPGENGNSQQMMQQQTTGPKKPHQQMQVQHAQQHRQPQEQHSPPPQPQAKKPGKCDPRVERCKQG